MSSFNKVILIGNLGNDPEIRQFQNGGRVANLSISTSEKWRDKNTGETRERTQWHRVVLFQEPSIRYAESYLRKGSKVMVEGKLETRSYQDQGGADRYITEVVVRPYGGNIIGLSKSGGSDGSSEGGSQFDQGRGGRHDDGVIDNDGGGGGPYNDLDDEIPF